MFCVEDPSEISVVVVEKASSVRQLIFDVLRTLGVQHIIQFSTAKELLGYLEVEDPNWVILPAMIDDEINALQVLKLICGEPRLKSVRCTLAVDEEEESFLLPTAFELGLMSFHQRSFYRADVESAVEDLFTIARLKDWNAVQISAEYLRRLLDDLSLRHERVIFEKTLLRYYPGSSRQLISLAEAQFLSGKKTEALGILAQLKIIEPKSESAAKRLVNKHCKAGEDQSLSNNPYNVFGLKTVVLIDPDSDMLQFMAELFESVGVKETLSFEGGDEAWSWLSENPEPDLIVQEWRITGVTGPLLIQRIRGAGLLQVPILVTSSLMEQADIPLALEMGIDHVINKPFEASDFLRSVVWVLQQKALPTEARTFETKIRRCIDSGKKEEALRLLGLVQEDPRIPEQKKDLMHAEVCYAHGELPEARRLCSEALSSAESDVNGLNLLAKILIEYKDFESAAVALEQAQKLCPMNVSRLVKMAEVNMEMGNLEGASEHIRVAEGLDSGSPVVQEAKCRVAVESGDVDTAREIFVALDCCAHVVSQMNIRAIALARTGRFEKGIELYEQTLASLPKRMVKERHAVYYNLALAQARYGNYDEALVALKEVEGNLGRVEVKSRSLERKIEASQRSGTRLKFNESSHQEALSNHGENPSGEYQRRTELVISSLETRPGELCCYKIFIQHDFETERCSGLLEKLPHFKTRKGLVKAS